MLVFIYCNNYFSHRIDGTVHDITVWHEILMVTKLEFVNSSPFKFSCWLCTVQHIATYALTYSHYIGCMYSFINRWCSWICEEASIEAVQLLACT